MGIKHVKTLAGPSNGNAQQVQPADWNADHQLTGLLALFDALTNTANKVLTFDASGNPELMNKSAILSGLSPVFTGVPTAPTASAGTNTDQLATTAFVAAAISILVTGAPTLLNTLDEIAAALGDDPNFATTMTTLLALKAPLASPAFSGNPTVPNQAALNNSTRAANTAYVEAAVAAALAAAGTGSMVASAVLTYATNAAISAVIPVDDTVPLVSEGTQIMTTSFTPKATANKLRLRFSGEVSAGGAENAVVAIFVGSTCVGAQLANVDGVGIKAVLGFECEFSPGSIAAQTISVRAGGSGANSIYFNGNNAGRFLGGASAAMLVIEEIKG